MPTGVQGFGIDIGGSGIKAALVDVGTGELIGRRIRVKTPQPSTPGRCIKVIQELITTLAGESKVEPTVPAGVGIPAVAIGGVVQTAANIHHDWIRFAAGDAIGEALKRPTKIINDADAAGLAEMQFGAGRGHQGTVLIITLGTGIGSALFLDGKLLPNAELGHIEIRGKDAETRASANARIRRKLSWNKWAAELDEYLHRIDALLWPDLIIIGGGISKEAGRYLPRLTVRPPVVPAQLQNEAGIVGAAMHATGADTAARGAAVDGPSA